jgi:hypothetical protein
VVVGVVVVVVGGAVVVVGAGVVVATAVVVVLVVDEAGGGGAVVAAAAVVVLASVGALTAVGVVGGEVPAGGVRDAAADPRSLFWGATTSKSGWSGAELSRVASLGATDASVGVSTIGTASVAGVAVSASSSLADSGRTGLSET